MKIIIVGAGVAGLSIGWQLARSGADVTVLDRAQPGQGATWAAAGMIAVTGESHTEASQLYAIAKHSAALWPGFAAEIESASGVNVGFRKNGALVTALDEPSLEELRSRAAAGGAEILSAGDARAREPLLAQNIMGALWDADEGQVNNRALGLALTRAFKNAGGTILANEAVIRIDHDGTRAVSALTPFKVYPADVFVLAAGAWTAQIANIPPDALPPVRPMKGEMLALQPPNADALPKSLVWGNGIYLVPRNGRLFVGATLEDVGFDTSLTKAAKEFLLNRAYTLMPALREWGITEHWAGLRPGSPDGLPILGQTSLSGLYAATGQFRNGILLAPAIADALNCLILNKPPQDYVASFNPSRFAQVSAAGTTGK